ncbi:MAG TPA: GTPase ObgE [Planctomycetes bacterium]|nr:GTPase ObgE [Planctomycetota bacterium]HIN79631.1 GTPase ObgE [Planctomycetota bacterium]
MRFIDEIRIRVLSGKGGEGCVSFRREKYVPRGGPDGGDGGSGGSVILKADSQVSTFIDYTKNALYDAAKGQAGSGRNRTGANASDLLLRVPVGTVVRDSKDGSLVADLTEDGVCCVVAEGGGGGRGNKSFATSTNQAPRERTSGADGIERGLDFELKVIADVGLLGLPNAGKSTFLSRVSAAHPRIADYPFTTLQPQLGIVDLDGERRMVIADIPGLIEGAHQGVGLGLEFLRHLERTRVLLHLLDPFERDIDQLVEDHGVVRNEIARYSHQFLERPILTVVNKSDLLAPEAGETLRRELQERIEERVYLISAVAGTGLRDLLEALWERLQPRGD